VDEGRCQQTPPLASQDKIGVGGSIVDQLGSGGVLGRDAVSKSSQPKTAMLIASRM